MLGATICGPQGPQVSEPGINPYEKLPIPTLTANLNHLYAYIGFNPANNIEQCSYKQ